MVAASSIPTYGDLDDLRTDRRIAAVEAPSSGPEGGEGFPGGALRRVKTAEAVRSFTVTISTARRAETDRLYALWHGCARGALPVLATPPWGGDPVPVLLDASAIGRAFRSAGAASISVPVRVYRG